MKKASLFSLIVLLFCCLTACSSQKNNEKSSTQSSTTKTSNEAIDDEDSDDNEDYEDDDEYDEENSSSVSFEIDTSRLTDENSGESYKVPSSLSAYVGTYKGESPEIIDHGDINRDKKATKVELKINKDGTFYKLVTTATFETAKMSEIEKNNLEPTVGGYFDTSHSFQTKPLSPTVSGINYYIFENIHLSRGVVVEKFGKLYLVEFSDWTKSSDSKSPYLKENGEIDYLKSVFLPSMRSTMNYYSKVIPSNTEERNAYFRGIINYEEEFHLSDNLEQLDSISEGIVTASKTKLEKSDQVSDILKRSLSEQLTDEFFEKYISSENDLFQVAHGSYMGGDAYLSTNNGENLTYLPLSSDLKEKIYDAAGNLMKVDYGYFYEQDDGTKVLTVSVGQKIYTDVREQDGVFVAK